MTTTFTDEFIDGWTEERVRQHYGFDLLDDRIRERFVPGGPSSICREVRHKVAGFCVQDMRSGKRLRVKSKRTANKIVDIIIEDYYDALADRDIIEDYKEQKLMEDVDGDPVDLSVGGDPD